MESRIPQSVAKRVPFKAFLSTDHVTAATGKTIAITTSQNGGAFAVLDAGAANAVEIGSGWYYIDLLTADTDTKGPLVVRGTEGTIDPAEVVYDVVNATNAGFTALPAVVAGAALGVPLKDANSFLAVANMPAVAPGGTNGLFIAGTNAATTITTGLTTHFIGTVDVCTTNSDMVAEAPDAAAIEAACDTSLVSVNLDHLMKTAVANNADMTVEVADGTVLCNIMSQTSDTSTYDVTGDSLEAIRDNGDAAWATATSVTVTGIANNAITAAAIAANAFTANAFAANALVSATFASSYYSSVNAEIVDVMTVDTTTLPGQEAPSLAPTISEMMAWLYKSYRNREIQTATQYSLFADNGTTVDAKATISDNGTTFDKNEVVTGP